MAKILCKLIGHKPVKGELQRSPYTVYTHWQDTTCARCGQHLSEERFYFDALTQPEMFASDAGKKTVETGMTPAEARKEGQQMAEKDLRAFKLSRFLGIVAGVPAKDEEQRLRDIARQQCVIADKFYQEQQREKNKRLSAFMHSLYGFAKD